MMIVLVTSDIFKQFGMVDVALAVSMILVLLAVDTGAS